MIDAQGTVTLVSVATVWEIEIKRALGRLAVPGDIRDAIVAGAYLPLPITVDHAVAAARLPLLHRDPFDRLLVAQAMVEELTIVTRDDKIAAYGVPVLWE